MSHLALLIAAIAQRKDSVADIRTEKIIMTSKILPGNKSGNNRLAAQLSIIAAIIESGYSFLKLSTGLDTAAFMA
jgi:hypothetical protein